MNQIQIKPIVFVITVIFFSFLLNGMYRKIDKDMIDRISESNDDEYTCETIEVWKHVDHANFHVVSLLDIGNNLVVSSTKETCICIWNILKIDDPLVRYWYSGQFDTRLINLGENKIASVGSRVGDAACIMNIWDLTIEGPNPLIATYEISDTKFLYCCAMLDDNLMVFNSREAEFPIQIWNKENLTHCYKVDILPDPAENGYYFKCLLNLGKGLFAAGDRSRGLSIWDLNDKSQPLKRAIPIEDAMVTCLANFPGGNIMWGNENSDVTIWDLSTNKIIGGCSCLAGPINDILCIEGKIIVVACSSSCIGGDGDLPGGEIQIWNTDPSIDVILLQGHKAAVTSLLNIGQDADTIVSGSVDGTIKIWTKKKNQQNNRTFNFCVIS